MNTFLPKIGVIALLFLGEACAIYAEMLGARTHAISTQPFLSIFLKMLLIMFMGGALLISGYMLGFRAFRNIWIVSAISITSILIVEPILAYLLFQQLPTKGAAIGLVLGIMGFFSALFL